MTGRRQATGHDRSAGGRAAPSALDRLADRVGAMLPARLPTVPEVVAPVAIRLRAIADRLAGPVERWCPICELELKLQASNRADLASSGDDDA